MNRRVIALGVAAALGAAESAPAIDLGLGLFKKRQEQKQAKADAGEKQLVATLQTDLDEGRRKAAAEGLRKHDPKANFEIVAALAGAVGKDPSPEVRAVAAESLGTFKLVYQQAVDALEKAEAGDPDKTVRAAAKQSLWQYTLNGYKGAAAKSQSAEPPLAKTRPQPPVSPGAVATKPVPDVLFRPITQGPGTAGPLPETSEPPLAKSAVTPEVRAEPKPVSTPTVAPPPSVPQKMPAVVPQQMPARIDPPKVELPAPPLPAADAPKPSALPLPGLPTIPPPVTVPTVQPPK